MLLILSRGSLDSSINLTSSPQIRGDSPKCPLHTSTHEVKGKPPRTKGKTVKPLLKLLNISFQSSRNKIQELEHVVNSVRLNVIFLLSRWNLQCSISYFDDCSLHSNDGCRFYCVGLTVMSGTQDRLWTGL